MTCNSDRDRELRILLVDDSDDDAELILRHLHKGGFTTTSTRVEDGESMRAALHSKQWDFVFCDSSMPQFGTAAALRLLKAMKPEIPFIAICGSAGPDTVNAAMRLGANAFVAKQDLAPLVPLIERIREEGAGLSGFPGDAETPALHTARVAHDINNALCIILAFSSLLLDKLDAKSPLRSDLEEIEKAGRSAAALTKTLIPLYRRDAPRFELVDLNEIVEGMQGALRLTLGPRITLAMDLSARLPRVHAHRAQFEAAVMNLALNARDAMPTGGTFTIETANVGRDEAPDITLTVSDDGIGMSEQVRGKLFRGFFTTKDKGSGLGLSSVLAVVQSSGGTIGVESAPGKGAKFTARWPVCSCELAPVIARSA